MIFADVGFPKFGIKTSGSQINIDGKLINVASNNNK